MSTLNQNTSFQTKLLALLAGTALSVAAQYSYALNIALTNDDGWDAIGIQTLHEALVDAGHTVILAGSSENQSGSGAAINLGVNNLRVTKQFEDGNPAGGSDQYSVALATGEGAEPSTAGLIAINIAELYGTPVDLLISGTNAGANVGAWTNLSGTVGAIINGLSYTKGKTVPGIAISTDEPIPASACPEGSETYCEEANRAHFQKVAHWMVDFLSTLAQKPGYLKREEKLLPPGIGLNINYPTFETVGEDENGPIISYLEEAKGVALSTQGKLAFSRGQPRAYPVGCYANCVKAPVGTPIPAGITANPVITDIEENRFADTTAFAEGKITIVPFEVDLTADFRHMMKFKRLVHRLNHH